MKNGRLRIGLCAVFLAVAFVFAASIAVQAAWFSKGSKDYYQEGLNHFQKKNYYLSMQSLEKALQLKPDYPEALGVLGWDYIKVGRALDAEAIFTKKYKRITLIFQPSRVWPGQNLRSAKTKKAKNILIWN